MHMVLRLFYILLLITGIGMILMNFHLIALVKGLLAFWLIFTMELIATRTGKGTLAGSQKTIFWIQFVVAIIVVLYFGYFLT